MQVEHNIVDGEEWLEIHPDTDLERELLRRIGRKNLIVKMSTPTNLWMEIKEAPDATPR